MKKRKSVIRLLSFLMVLLMFTTLLTACGGAKEPEQETSQEPTEDPTEEQAQETETEVAETPETPTRPEFNSGTVEPTWKKNTSPITIDWYVNLSYATYRWGDIATDAITEKTGVTVNLTNPVGNEDEAMNTMLASGDLPDVITIYREAPQVMTMEENGLVYALDELADKYDPYFWEVAYPSIVGWFTREDGHLYGWPSHSTPLELMADSSQVTGNTLFMVRSDMYEAIGSPDMRTIDGFRDALRAVKEKFPEVNGQPTLLFGGHEASDTSWWGFDAYLQDFLAVPWETEDGKLYDRRTDPEYIRWLKAFREMYHEGLIPNDLFIDKNKDIDDKIVQGRYFALLHQAIGIGKQRQVMEATGGAYYKAIDGIFNSKLEQPQILAANVINGWLMSFITKDCKDPARTIQFFSYLISEEGQKDCALGVKGETYDTQEDGVDRLLPEMREIKENDKDLWLEKYGAGEFYYLMNPGIWQQWNYPLEEPEKSNIDWTKGKSKSQAVYTNLYPPATTDEGIAYNEIEHKWAQTLPKLMTAETEEEFDRLLQEFIEFREAHNWDAVLEIMNANLAKNKAKLGIE